MKKILLILLIFAAISARSQITIPNDTVWSYEKDTVINLAVYGQPFNQAIDRVMYRTQEYPAWIPIETVDAIFESKAIKGTVIYANGKRYLPERKPRFGIYADYRVQLYQLARVYTQQINKQPPTKRFWYYYKYAKDNNINPVTFWNHPLVDTIVNELYMPLNDSIQ